MLGLAAGLVVAVAALVALSEGAVQARGALRPPAALETSEPDHAPRDLAETGLYSDFGALEVDPRHVAFAPQYPLWTDGATKRRWMSLPPGTAVDGSDPDRWIFPVGTRFWKEFSFGGRRVETRLLEQVAPGAWRYAAYEWSPDGGKAVLVSEQGRRGVHPLPGGRSHAVPSVQDCRACHEAGPNAVLGFSALQLSPDRDPGSVPREESPEGGADLVSLVRAGLLAGFPEALLATPPRIRAASEWERSALGYLHGNCGHCHNGEGKLKNLLLELGHSSEAGFARAVATTLGQAIRKRAPGQSAAALRVEPGHPERSGLLERMASRYAALQMPPLGTELVDERAVALVARWIEGLDQIQAKHRQ